MRRIIFSIAAFLFSLTSVMGQKIPINLPADGNWPTIVGDSIMIIGPRQNELTEEQRYFNPVYMIVYPGKEHLQAQIIRAGLCDCDLTKPNRRIGVFSVAPDKKVSFSQGNLQYLPAINLWKFANTQYEYLGNANKYLKPTFRNWVDLFGWSANNTTAPFGVSTSTNAADYAGDFVDWGTNTICGDAPNTWRTLSRDEWEYLLNGRENANKLRCRAQVNNVNGFVFLPDQWLCPEGIELKIEQLTTQVFTFDAWSKMENAGAVFLPAAGRLNDKQLVNFDDHGNYWSSTRIDNTNVDYFAFTFSTNKLHVDHQSPIHLARSVRLVHDTIVSEPIPEPCLVVKVNDTLSINMMCVEGGTFMMGQGEDAHPVSLSSYSIGQTEVTQALWEAVMGTNPSANTANKQLPVTNISWYDCQEFIKKLNQQTGMRFRLPTEAEWEYAARGGQRSKGYVYAGSDDLKEVAWYNGNSGNAPHIVAQKKPNELGIYDMSGNVWEWCHDWHAPCPTTHQYNPLGPEVGKVVGKRYLRVFRGGSYGYEAAYHQNAFRDITGPEPNIGTANLGLRLVLSDDVNFETIHVNDTLSFHIMDVKGGTFMMGDDNTSNASPAHQVTLSDYYIGQTEVTQTLWKAVMGNVPTGNKNPSYPVGYVSYADCQDFIAKLNNLTGLNFQLPTEAEWEYAAMGGNRSHGYIYSGSNTIDDVAWYDQNSENKLHHVGAKQPNELGIYDMSGNAWEWCADYHGKYTAENQINPQGPATGAGRVIRSGSFRTTADRCTNKHRQAREADYPDSHITLRLVLHDTEPRPEPEYVDLGLSVKWATFNVGASKPEDYGDYFAWGETEPKEEYSWATYKWCQGTANTFTKYCSNSQYGNADYKTILDPEDDAAIVHWGSDWRMPTIDEWLELKQKCSWKKIIINGITGYQVTAKNGNSIFLPRAGLRRSDILYANDSVGYYASSNHLPEFSHEDYASYMLMYDNSISKSSTVRYYGLSIRPVYDDIPDPCLVVKVNDTLSINLMCVEGGTFTMGAMEGDTQANANEKPAHEVTLSDYYIAQTELTQEVWEVVMGTTVLDEIAAGGSNETTLGHGKNYPMYAVSYNDCKRFIAKLNQITHLTFNLPTEAEWEYAARGGQLSKGYLYAGSNNPDEVARHSQNPDNTKVYPVATLRPNELGIYDMAGNIWEWVEDGRRTYTFEAQVNPIGPKVTTIANMRGGSSYYELTACRVSDRGREQNVDYKQTRMGIRLVLHDTEPRPEPEYVDLGLSVKWATFNVGATSPEDYGDYFAWGETEPKETYSWATYKWCKGTDKTMTKYCSDSNYGNNGFTDNKMELDLSDDAARANWGGNWRMPTDAELTELREQCTWTWTTQDGVNGYKVTSKKSGYTDKSIFLPAAGYRFENSLRLAGEYGYFWSNSLTTDGPNHACFVRFGQYYALGVTDFRRYGFAVRAVYDDRPPKRIGVFSVAADKQVSFSQGHLQYVQSTDTWQFAANQLEYMGHKHYRNGQLADTIEYFGWSGKDSKAPWGISLSTESSDYEGEFLDWGTNTIAGSAPNTWRTLSNEELLYICQGRKNADQLLGLGTIGAVTGLIILPDDWQLPAGLSFTPNTDNATKNQYTYNQWVVMENAGAVFIPPTGYFNHKLTNIRGVNEMGYYRGSTLADDGRQIYMLYDNSRIRYSYSGNNDGNLYYAFSVRLVHDTIVPDYVDLGLSVKWATFNVGATSPEDYGDYFAWGETEPKETYSWATYKWCDGTDRTMTKYCTNSEYGADGFTDSKTILEPEDDAAHVHWGGKWRMPSDEEFTELREKCTWTWVEQNGINGYIVKGPNDNTIFMPIGGYMNGTSLTNADLRGYYWSSSIDLIHNRFDRTCIVSLDSSKVSNVYSYRRFGLPIRPVYDDRVE